MGSQSFCQPLRVKSVHCLIGNDDRPSPDRGDNMVGYEESNVEWTTARVNKMKGDMDREDFVTLCAEITEYHNKELD